MAVERDEIPGFEDFYKPLTSREETLPKLQALKAKPISDVSGVDLFEALADAFATIATEDFETGVVDPGGAAAEEWEATDEVWINNPQTCIGSYRVPGPHYRSEQFFMTDDDINRKGSVYFSRDSEGHIITQLRGEDIGDYELPDDVKHKILDVCLAGFSS